MDATAAIINVLAGFEPGGEKPRRPNSKVFFEERPPREGYMMVSDGTRSWIVIGDYDATPSGDETITAVRPRSALAVLQQEWRDQTTEHAEITVIAPVRVADQLLKLAAKIVNEAPPEILHKILPSHASLVEIAEGRKTAIRELARKRADKEEKSKWEAALHRARKYAANEHTAQTIAQQFL